MVVATMHFTSLEDAVTFLLTAAAVFGVLLSVGISRRNKRDPRRLRLPGEE